MSAISPESNECHQTQTASSYAFVYVGFFPLKFQLFSGILLKYLLYMTFITPHQQLMTISIIAECLINTWSVWSPGANCSHCGWQTTAEQVPLCPWSVLRWSETACWGETGIKVSCVCTSINFFCLLGF